MTLLLALQAAAIFAPALLLVRVGSASARRASAIAAFVMVAALPVLGWAPRWSLPAAPVGVVDTLGALQEPSGEAVDAAPTGSSSLPGPGMVWALGLVFAAARLSADLWAVRALRSSARDRVGDVAISDRVEVPVVVGVLRPLVLLPAESTGWTAEHRALVLAHERAHVAGADNLWLLLGRVVAGVHWFDPFAWLALAALRDACEQRADAVALDGGADPATYAGVLIDAARRVAPRSALAMARPGGLERRVRAVLGERRRSGRLAVAAQAGLVTLLALGTATAAPNRASSEVRSVGTLDALLAAEADRIVAERAPEGVALVVLDAHSGAILGTADRGGLLERPVSAGSVLKPFVVAAAIEAGLPTEGPYGEVDVATLLARSSNPGAVALAEAVGRPTLDATLASVGIGAPPELPIERLALGDGLLLTPLQVARAWTHLAGAGGLDAATASEVRSLLVGVVEREDGTGRAAAVPGRTVAGKTGTAHLVLADGSVDPDRTLASFVGLVPADDPEVVILVSVGGARGPETWGGVVAAPVFARIAGSI